MNGRMKKLLLLSALFVALVSLCLSVFYVSAAEQTVYLDSAGGSDSNSGTLKSPYKTLDMAMSRASTVNTKIVLLSDLSISGNYEEPVHNGDITITSNNGSSVVFPSSTCIYRMNGKTSFESVNIKMKTYVIIAAQFNPIVFGNDVNIENGSKYALLVGGFETPDSVVETGLDSSITINSGDFYKVCGFSRTKGAKTQTFTGTSFITVNGGNIGDLYGASLSNHISGSTLITINGGNVTRLHTGGDATRRLDGSAVVNLCGGSVESVAVNNVVGDATLNLRAICPQSVSVSYGNDTVKTLAEKAGSTKTANYNALYCPDSIVSLLEDAFDVVNNATVLYTGEGDGDGSSPDSPMRSFNCAYEKLAEYGGTLYVVGESKCDGKIKDKGYERAVVIEGYSDRSSIVMTDGYTLDLYTDTTIRSVGFETSGNAVISCRSAVLSLEDGIVCSSGISVEMCGDTDLLLTVRSGSYASVVGAAAESAKNVKVNIIGARVDSVLGARYNAQSVRVEVVGSGVGTLRAADGEVLDSYVVKLAESDVSEYTASLCSGKSIFSVADAAVDALDLSALSGSGESTLVLGRGTDEDELSEYHKYFDLVKRENAVFIADGGTGKGLSALSPMGDIKSAVKALGASGSVVVCGDVTVESSYHQVAAHSYPVTITSVCEDADYRDRAYLVLNDDLIFGGETCIENIQLACSASSVFIYAYEHKLTIGYGVDTTLTNANTSYINITGGRSLSSGNGDADITINSGNWGKVRCGSVKTGTVSKSRSKIDITVNGGIFHGYFVCGSRGNVYGDIDLVVNDGVFYQGIYAVFEEDTVKYDKYFNYDVVFDIRGGEFYSYIAPACSKTTELHGSYTVYARGGNFDHLTDMCGAQEYAGDMTSALFRDPSVDTEALPEGSSSFTNYLRHNNADPWLFYHDGYYYYTRTGGTTISLIKTANIGDIKGAYSKVILRPTEGKNLWSPEIHYFSDEEAGEGQGGWYMFVGYDDGTTSNQRQYVLKCLDGDDLMGRWGDPVTGELNTPRRVAFPDSPQTNEEEFTGGMSVLRVDGKTYITFVSEQGRGTSDFHQTINICEMENPWTMKGVPTVICEPEYDWEKGGAGYSATLDSWYPQVVEGASAVYSDTGDVYLMYTGSGYWTVYYQLGYMKLTGSDPLLRSSWTKNPSSIFSLSDEINGCGHASYFKDHNGDYWACYHAYTGKDTSSKRSSFVERIYVTSDGVSIGNGSGHPAPIDTVYTLSLNPKPLCEKISGFGLIEEMSEHQRLYTIIYTPEELMELMNSPDMWNAVYILGADIDLSLYQGQYGQAPIGSLSVSFTGVFDGRGYSIRGLDITSDGAVGLFGRIGGSAVVRNLSVYGIVKNTYGAASAESTDESGNYISTGGVVGSLAGGTVKDVVSRVNVYGNGNTGGVVGIVDAADDSSLVVEGCISYAEIYNTLGNTGGVIGRIRARGSGEIRISSCINYSDVSVTSSDRCRAAGIVGYTRTESQSVIIEKCANYGDISGINRQTATNHIPHVGGIAGRIEITIGADAGVVIRECKNEGSVKSSVRAGGIVGILTRSEPCTAESGIYLCENRGSVTGEFYSSTVQIGGIAGYVDNNCDAVNFRINDCANYAGISCEGGKCYAGGIIGGQDASDLYSCVNYGSVSGHSSGYAGAFTGVQVNDGAYVTENCYALEGSAGALSGYFREAFCTMKNNSFVTGQNMTALSAYPALDFDGVWVMRDEGAVLLVYAPALAGDADGDAWLTSSDITILIRYLSGWSVDEDVSVCDMNSDGIINNRDAIAMIRVLALIVK